MPPLPPKPSPSRPPTEVGWYQCAEVWASRRTSLHTNRKVARHVVRATKPTAHHPNGPLKPATCTGQMRRFLRLRSWMLCSVPVRTLVVARSIIREVVEQACLQSRPMFIQAAAERRSAPQVVTNGMQLANTLPCRFNRANLLASKGARNGDRVL